MPAEQQKIDAWEAEKKAGMEAYRSFRYDDAQRERTIEFIGAAMRVIRGDAEFDSLKGLLPVRQANAVPPYGETARGGTRFSFDAGYLNDWSGMDVIGTTDARGKVDPYRLEIRLSPPMHVQRERLESLLGLKVVPGYDFEGGNLQYEFPDFLHGLPPFKGGNFEYSLLNPPHAPYVVRVKFVYLSGPSQNPLTHTRLTRLQIHRKYLTSEQIRERDHKRFGHLPRSLERCTKSGVYIPHFADDELTRVARKANKRLTTGVGSVFGNVAFWNSQRQSDEYVPAWWEWIGPDPMEEALARFFGDRRQG